MRKHTLLGQRENKTGTPFKTYDNEKRAVGNPLQTQFCHKAHLDKYVEGCAKHGSAALPLATTRWTEKVVYELNVIP